MYGLRISHSLSEALSRTRIAIWKQLWFRSLCECTTSSVYLSCSFPLPPSCQPVLHSCCSNPLRLLPALWSRSEHPSPFSPLSFFFFSSISSHYCKHFCFAHFLYLSRSTATSLSVSSPSRLLSASAAVASSWWSTAELCQRRRVYVLCARMRGGVCEGLLTRPWMGTMFQAGCRHQAARGQPG